MKVYFRSNLDIPQIPSEWNGDNLNHLPAIGAEMMVPYHGYDVGLEVVAHRYFKNKTTGEWCVEVELHIGTGESVAQWEARMRDLRDHFWKR